MGHRLSKSPTTFASGNYTPNTEQVNNSSPATTFNKTEQSKQIPISPPVGPTINLQIQKSPTTSRGGNNRTFVEELCDSGSNSLSSVNNSCPRQIIIKIQLAKMENGNEQPQQQAQDTLPTESMHHGTDTNQNQVVNVTLNRNLVYGESQTLGTERSGTAGGSTVASTSTFNNNVSNNHVLKDEQLEQVTAGLAEIAVNSEDDLREAVNHVCVAEANVVKSCCRRKSKTSSTYLPKRRCYKCTCRDAIKRIIETSSSSSSLSKSTKHKERKENKHSKNTSTECAAVRPTAYPQAQCGNTISMTTSAPIAIAAATAGNATASGSNQLSIWAPNSNDVIIPINSQFVVVQCPSTSVMTVGCIDDNAIRLMATEIVNADGTANHNSLKVPQIGPIVHSQVDFVHCLVPDLEKITNSSFYWGKMDRYEAEHLLENKPEGTFLLRDSAQEEFLFSVTFRKYGRSLHARIEQGGHKFSFDCHDPCVFTADTVTGLLEHYKDPACVMFFEPMLTIPLHRKNTFSLQQLCRASIVSNTTYDGITELELPTRLKQYLREYHYKQKLRVKPFDEPFYACT